MDINFEVFKSRLLKAAMEERDNTIAVGMHKALSIAWELVEEQDAVYNKHVESCTKELLKQWDKTYGEPE